MESGRERRGRAGGWVVHSVGEAGDGLELLELLEKIQPLPDLVVCDIAMPRLRGLAAFDERRCEMMERAAAMTPRVYMNGRRVDDMRA